jgi:Stage II sporulation protein E (SpoIIE)/GAF domain
MDPALDWTAFDDAERASFVDQLDQATLRRSTSLQRVADLAALIAGSDFAQISLIGDEQSVPAAHGLGNLDDMQGTPIEHSLCSVTVASRGSLVIDDATTHPWVRHLPPVASGAVGAYVGVPMRTADGRLLGALCVYNAASIVWPDHVAGALEDLVGFAVREIELIATVESTSRFVEQLTGVIQRIVAPTSVAVPPGVQVTARYRSADVGGDWYEWTQVESEVESQISLVVGDVAGHGLHAVATMARLKSLVQAYVIEGYGPAEILLRAGRAFSAGGSVDTATVVAARFDPLRREMTYASAGHPPPLIIRPTGAEFAALRPGPPVGFGLTGASDHVVALREDDLVVLYTDGLFEQRGAPVTDSLESFRKAVETSVAPAAPLDEIADAIIRVSLSDTDDDACLVLLRA